MKPSLKKQIRSKNGNVSTDSNLKKVGTKTKKYLSSVKEYKPEMIKGYTYAF